MVFLLILFGNSVIKRLSFDLLCFNLFFCVELDFGCFCLSRRVIRVRQKTIHGSFAPAAGAQRCRTPYYQHMH